MPAPATPKRHNQQPPSAPLATPSAQSSAKKGIEASLEVFARLRPPAEKDADKVESTGRTYKVLEDGTLLQLVPPPGVKSSQAKIYTFKRVFGTEATQEMVFEGAALPLVDGVCTGIQNSLLVMYGMSGGGKTYTTVGSKADVGLLPRALTRIFQKVDTTTTTVAMSFAEIYIDNVYDLLLAKGADEKRAPLKLNKGASASAIVEGLSSTYVSSVDHGLSLFESANEQRVVGATKINSDSSRSHLVCMTALESRGKKRFLWIVDLAGSERGDRTEVEACSTRQGEGSSINKSLSTLFRCFQAMLKKQQFVPFRDSKLTHLLSYLLQGAAAGKTAMIANINPSVADFDETKTVCENAAKARKVKTTVGLNDDLQRQDGGGIWDCNGRRIAWASTVKRPSQKRKDRCYSLVAGAFAERNPRRRRSRSADSTERIRSSHESSRSAGGHGWHAPAREPETGVVDVEDRSQSLDQLAREKELATAAAKEAQRRVVELTEQLGEERRDGEKAQETIAALKGKLRQMDEQLDGSRKVEMELSDALETSEMLERNAREEAQATRAAVAAAGEELVKKGEKARQVAVKEIAALRDELASAKEGEASARGDTMRLQAAMAASEEARVSAVAQVEAFEGEESRLRSVAEAATHDQERLCRAQSEIVGAKAEVGVLKEQLAVALERTSVGEEASERLSRRLEEVSGRLALAEEERVATAGELEVAMRELAGVKGRLAVAEQDSVEAKAAETTAASELESLRQQLSEAIAAESAAANSAQAAAAQADVDLASLKEEVESSKKAMVSQDAHGREVLARLAEAERQAKDASAEAERASTELLSAQDEAARKMAALRDELASSRGNEASVKGEILCLQAAAAASEEARASAVAQVEALEGEVSQLRGTVEAAAHDEERLSRAQSEAAVAKAEVGALNEQLARAEESRAVTAGQLEVVVGELELVKGGLAVAKEEARAAEATAASELESLRQQLSEATASAVAQVDALEREGSRLRRVAEAAAHDQERLCRAQSEVAGAKAEVGVLKEQLAAAMERASVEQEARERLMRELDMVNGHLSWAEEERVTAAGELEVATRELVGVKGGLVVAEEAQSELVNLCPRTNKSQREPAAAVAMLASVDHPAAISESMAHPTAAGAQLPQQQQPLSVSDDQDSFAAEYDDIAGEEGRQSFWTQYDDVGGGDESTYLSGSENENEGGGVAIIAQPQGGLKKDIPYEQEEKEEHEESAEEQKDDEHEEEEEEEEEQSGNTPATPATKPAATPHVSEKDTAPPDRPTSMGDEGKSVGTTTADNSEKKRLAEDLVQSVTTKGVISVIVGVDGDAELFDGKYFSNICYEVPAGSTCAREGCEWQDESLEHYHLRCGCRTKKNTPLTFKAAATGGITTHEVRAHLLPLHRSDPVQAAGIMSDDDRRRLNICAYHPWPLAHSAHLGKAKPVRLGEEPDWQEAALSLRDEFGAKYTPEECLMEWRRTAYSSVENVGLDWLDVETRRFRRVLMVFSRKPYDNKHIKFDFIAAHLPGRDTAACHRKSVSEKDKRDSGL
eukprot:g2790.t1